MKIEVEIKDYTDTHCLAIVYRRGRQYSAVWAKADGEYPTIDEVKETYQENPKSFDAYNVVRGY